MMLVSVLGLLFVFGCYVDCRIGDSNCWSKTATEIAQNVRL